jgi:hypothetical protein
MKSVIADKNSRQVYSLLFEKAATPSTSNVINSAQQ